ncbi:MAG: DUF1295 domain-containing protein [Pseudomonadota bacterium]
MEYLKPILPMLLCFILLLASSTLTTLTIFNGIAQIVLFALVVQLPTWKTGRMSYVDIGWPLGVAVIGIVTLTVSLALEQGAFWRVLVVSLVMVVVGSRMGIAAVLAWRDGHLERELPRYQYQQVRWDQRGIENTRLMQQVETFMQGISNMSFLALPAFIISTNPDPAVHWLEVLGLAIWVAAFVMESVADAQKKAFLLDMREKQLRKQVCNVGLWRYSRHPNYFAEWMVWNSLIIAAIPSWLALYQREQLVIWALLGFCTLYTSRLMYYSLVTYSGAEPAEYYSVQKRAGYRDYQQQTNRFFPGPARLK